MRNPILKLISRRSVLFASVAAVALAAGVAFAGEGHGDDEGHDGEHGHAMAIGSPGKPSDVDRTVEIEAGDIYFNPESLEVKPGKTVRFVIHHKGDLLHEFNIGTPEMHAKHQEEMMEMMEHGMLTATEMKHDMEGMEHGEMAMGHDDPNSVLLEPGETKELIWTFPEGGELEFACNVPGHYPAGMQGAIEIGK